MKLFLKNWLVLVVAISLVLSLGIGAILLLIKVFGPVGILGVLGLAITALWAGLGAQEDIDILKVWWK